MVDEIFTSDLRSGPDQSSNVSLQFTNHFVHLTEKTICLYTKTVSGLDNVSLHISHAQSTSILTGEPNRVFIVLLAGLCCEINYQKEFRFQVFIAFQPSKYFTTVTGFSFKSLSNSSRLLIARPPQIVIRLVVARLNFCT